MINEAFVIILLCFIIVSFGALLIGAKFYIEDKIDKLISKAQSLECEHHRMMRTERNINEAEIRERTMKAERLAFFKEYYKQ